VGVNILGASETRCGLLLRRHGIAAFLVGASLLWGGGFAQVEDGRSASIDGNVVAALASDADSSADAERLRISATQGARYRHGERTT
jgi:hypothetical protein